MNEVEYGGAKVPLCDGVLLTQDFLAQTMHKSEDDEVVTYRRHPNGGGWVSERAAVHETALVSPSVVVNSDSVIELGVVLFPGVRLGRKVTVQSNSVLWHGVSAGDEVVIGSGVDARPGATFGRRVTVNDRAIINADVTAMDRVTIGERATICMGAIILPGVVIPDGLMVVVEGSPVVSARQISAVT